ncbi:GNAT family N-acetyltransferase [Chachezhania sediminis]|uniref:GNAT family N-acetyltransferase n=1 Tax=Chachezhania sediminis TaxID=2599291 RepID=UPI00131A720E|nr:GNAT family N-acetyltransferase [Chachezhania sediminis]
MTAASLTTDRLILSPPGAEDVDAMLAFFAAPRSEFYGGPLSAGAAWEKFAAYVGQWTLTGYGLFAIRLKGGGETIGLAGPFHPSHFPEPEMCWLLASDEHEGRGYASEACRAILEYLFTDLGWTTAVSYIDMANVPSRALALRLGARLDPDAPAMIPNCQTYRHSAPEGAA